MNEVIVTSSDNIQFRVVLHAVNEAQLNLTIATEQKWVGQRTAAELDSFHGDFVRIKSLDDLIACEPLGVSRYDPIFASGARTQTIHIPGVPKAGPKFTLIQGGLSDIMNFSSDS
jgi:hypothetical protein